MAVADRAKALEAALAQIEKVHGKGSVMRLGEDTRLPIDVVPTGSVALDVALGIGGLPRGRIVEIYGPESSGKTTVALHAIANAQAEGGICAFIDAEHALDRITRTSSASIPTSSWSHNRTTGNRPSRSRTHWCVPGPWRSSSSTRWQR